MKRFLLLPVFMAFCSALFGEANYVYHEETTTDIGCGGVLYRSALVPNHTQNILIGFKVEWQGYWNQARIYYTTDGSNPSGAFGAPTGTTQVVNANYVCQFCACGPGGVHVDIVRGTIPAQPNMTQVKYIVSAWHSDGGDEIFGSGCGNCADENRPAINADIYAFTVLPLELTRFEAEKGENFTKLNWETATETNNRAFQIERSPDAQNWETLEQMAGAGNSHETKNYNWTDRQPLDGTSYYRLRQIDFDGKSSLSPVRKIDRTSAIVFTVFPNPTVSSTTIKTSSATECEALVDLIDATGRWAGTVHFLLQKGENLLEMPLGGMPGGWYTLVYSAANGNFSQRIFIKSK